MTDHRTVFCPYPGCDIGGTTQEQVNDHRADIHQDEPDYGPNLDYQRDQNHTITITRDQLECWAGRPLTEEEVDRLDEALPDSSIPEAIATIVGEMT